MKTPEQIARESLAVDCYDGTDEPIIETIDDLVSLMVRAIEADRKQQGEKLYREAVDRVKAVKEFREKHEAEYTCFKKTGELD